MNPIEQWRALRDMERMSRTDNPACCVMGTHDYSAFCGALAVLYYHNLGLGDTGMIQFEGITIRESRSVEKGMMFG